MAQYAVKSHNSYPVSLRDIHVTGTVNGSIRILLAPCRQKRPPIVSQSQSQSDNNGSLILSPSQKKKIRKVRDFFAESAFVEDVIVRTVAEVTLELSDVEEAAQKLAADSGNEKAEKPPRLMSKPLKEPLRLIKVQNLEAAVEEIEHLREEGTTKRSDTYNSYVETGDMREVWQDWAIAAERKARVIKSTRKAALLAKKKSEREGLEKGLVALEKLYMKQFEYMWEEGWKWDRVNHMLLTRLDCQGMPPSELAVVEKQKKEMLRALRTSG